MNLSRRSLMLCGITFIAACGGSSSTPPPPPPPPPAPPPPPPPPAPPPPVSVTFSFAAGTDGFTSDFAEYAPGQEVGPTGIQFRSEFRRLPPPLDNRFGLLVAGTNRSDDLFMYIWRPVTGLVPGQRYRVFVEINIATNVPGGCAGIGGAPGESVFVKAGASVVQPAQRVESNRVVTNLDKGSQATSGRELVLIGDFAGGGGACGNGQYRTKLLNTASSPALPSPQPPPDALLLTADAQGRLWIVIGTDSGFEGRTEIYYLDGRATFTPV